MATKSTGPATRRAFAFEVKAFDDAAGTFEGYANTYARDSYGDVVVPGAFKRTIDHHRAAGKRIPLLSQHDSKTVVGWIDPNDCAEDTTGLFVKATMLLKTQAGNDDYERAKAGLLSMSIGYDTIAEEVDRKTATRYLKELRLWEVSVVTFPANDSSVITSIKAGRTLSAATLSAITEAHAAAKAACDHLAALMGDGAEDDPATDTPEAEKSAPTPDVPDVDVARIASEIKAAADADRLTAGIAALADSMKKA